MIFRRLTVASAASAASPLHAGLGRPPRSIGMSSPSTAAVGGEKPEDIRGFGDGPIGAPIANRWSAEAMPSVEPVQLLEIDIVLIAPQNVVSCLRITRH